MTSNDNEVDASKILNLLWPKKVSYLLIALIFMYIVTILDRGNISYALAAGMIISLGAPASIASTVGGLASGIFFIGYVIPQVFTNYIIYKTGIRKLFTIVFIIWGILTILTGMVTNIAELYILRFLLGVAEAAFFPGVIYFLTLWFTVKERAKANSIFMLGYPLAGVVGAPIAGAILSYYTHMGWRYLFYYEGIISLFMALVAWIFITDNPLKAKWLTKEQKNVLIDALDKEKEKKEEKFGKYSVGTALKSLDVWNLLFIYFAAMLGSYGVTMWTPTIIKGLSHVTAASSAFLTTIPYIFMVIGMLIWGISSDRRKERKWHTFGILMLSGVTLWLSAIAGYHYNDFLLAYILLILSYMGSFSVMVTFWALPQEFLAGASAAVGIALINAFGNLGGFVGPYVAGYLDSLTGSYYYSLVFLSVVYIIGALLVILVRKHGAKAL
ncbi:MAG: MFS transporter [Nitrososphaerota archaeon]|jgi:MFS family permease|nr:MFS transporter [Nitrososphaerota archaeon]MDG6930594.1 MFS transporter [Nitrososphaerota archaeon]